MINLTDVSIQYPEDAYPVLDKVNLEIQPATLNLVTGESGSGKSTLLRCINGLIPHFSGGQISGKIDVFGRNPITTGPADMANIVGFVFQDPEAQFVYDVVEDEIAFMMENAGTPRSTMQNRLDDVCQKLGLGPIRMRKIQNLSGGEKQLVAIASVLVGLPQVILLDEPTSQLDAQTADDVLRAVVKLKQEFGLTVLIAEHRLERLLPYTEQLIHIPKEGPLRVGSPQAILQEMPLVPPIVEIARKLKINPLPIRINDFPNVTINADTPSKNVYPNSEKIPKSPLLKINDLSVRFGPQPILKNINLALYQGEILTLMGPNGAGKTTLLRTILGLTASKGEKHLFTELINDENLNPIISNIAYLPQNPNDLLFAETILDELHITLKNHNKEINDDEITQFLKFFNLEDKQDHYPRDLSVGERQRTALAAITVHDPPIIILDEPTRGLDYANKKTLAERLISWRKTGKAILVVTHDIEFAAQLADRVTILEKGEIVFSGSPTKAFTQFPAYQTQTARLFPGTNWIIPDDLTLLND
ncbi:MAG: ATP-binding cassette domain-containing protein [Chloroflexota bacterium]|nr:ATP-binding cassette domain-containing protein [Chloroflexota bacterium]